MFVVAAGRSGSTLVQGLLNAIPGTLVRGENDLYLLGLYRVMHRFLEFRELHTRNRTRQVTSPFYGLMAIRRGLFVRAARQVFVEGALGPDPRPDVTRLGFKEVLWHRIDRDETEDFFAFLDDAFPGVRYVLNSRDPEVVVGSGFWKGQDPARAKESVERVFEVQDFLRVTRPDRTFDIEYEQLTGPDLAARDDLLRGLVDFVTRRPASDGLLADLRQVMSRGHGPHPFGASRKDSRGAVRPSTS